MVNIKWCSLSLSKLNWHLYKCIAHLYFFLQCLPLSHSSIVRLDTFLYQQFLFYFLVYKKAQSNPLSQVTIHCNTTNTISSHNVNQQHTIRFFQRFFPFFLCLLFTFSTSISRCRLCYGTFSFWFIFICNQTLIYKCNRKWYALSLSMKFWKRDGTMNWKSQLFGHFCLNAIINWSPPFIM